MKEMKAKYINGKWIPIDSCASCGSACGIDGVFICGELAIISEFINDELDLRIPGTENFHPGCPLPDYDLIKWHSKDEKPEAKYFNNENHLVLCKFHATPRHTNIVSGRYYYASGTYHEDKSEWRFALQKNSSEIITFIGWRYFDE